MKNLCYFSIQCMGGGGGGLDFFILASNNSKSNFFDDVDDDDCFSNITECEVIIQESILDKTYQVYLIRLFKCPST